MPTNRALTARQSPSEQAPNRTPPLSQIRAAADLSNRLEREIPEAIARTLTAAGERLQAEARALIGTEPAIWPALAESTVEEKTRLGFTGQVSETDPLLRTGELRASITATADPDGITLGSTSPIAAWMEQGTMHVPARPFLAPTVAAHAEDIAHSVADAVAETIRNALRQR